MEMVEENGPPNELMPGDLLFSIVTAGGVEYVAHALIYAPNQDYPLLPVVHAVSNERKGLHRVMATSLPEGNYRVFRCRDQDLIVHGAGVRCSMFAAICYQASAVSRYVTPNPPGTWSSNKYADPEQMPKEKLTRLSVKEVRRLSGSFQNKRLSAKFQHAAEHAQEYKKMNIVHSEDKHSRAENHPRYRPAVLNWSSEQFPAIAKFNFKAAVTPGLYFDQKTIDIIDMVQSLKNDEDHWDERPRLHVAKKEPTQEEKAAYAEQVSLFLEKADDNTQRFTKELKHNLGLKRDDEAELEQQEMIEMSPRH